MSRLFRVAAAVILWSALITQFVLFVTDEEKRSLLDAVVKYFSYFTILTNLFGAVVMSAVVIPGASKLWKAVASPASRTAAVLYLGIVAVVYHVLLAPLWHPQGWQLATDIVLHTAAPLALAAEWMLFTPKSALTYRSTVLWLALPLAYGAYTLVRGAVAGVYPYFFLNASQIGYPQTLLNLAGLLAVFAAGGAGLVAVGRKFPRPLAEKSNG